MSVNLSPLQLAMADFTEGLAETLRSTSVEPGDLILEVTEGA